MNILLTGTTGFIGSHIAREILRRGNQLRCPIRKTSDLSRIADISGAIETVDLDLFNCADSELDALCDSIDLCIHSAWYAVPGQYLTSHQNVACVDGSMRLLQALARSGCRRSVFIGTCFEYDLQYGYLIEDTTPLKPENLYAAAKLATYNMGLQAAKLHEMQFAWVRLFYQYGPFEDNRRLVPHVINSLINEQPANVTHGLQFRDFLHVFDVASAVYAIAASDLTGAVNVGSGHPVMVRDIVQTIATILQRPELVNYGARAVNSTDPMFVCANNNKLVEATGWRPQFDLRSGLQSAIEWWKENSARK